MISAGLIGTNAYFECYRCSKHITFGYTPTTQHSKYIFCKCCTRILDMIAEDSNQWITFYTVWINQ